MEISKFIEIYIYNTKCLNREKWFQFDPDIQLQPTVQFIHNMEKHFKMYQTFFSIFLEIFSYLFPFRISSVK